MLTLVRDCLGEQSAEVVPNPGGIPMRTQPRVGLTFRYEQSASPYESALRKLGLDTIRIAPDTQSLIQGLCGLVLTGGVDINPARYGQLPHPASNPPDNSRDEMEVRLIEVALRTNIPILGICRGMQILNVVHGGTLIQDLATSINHTRIIGTCEKPSSRGAVHFIVVSPGTHLAKTIGEGRHEVNSRHHQAIAELGRGLIASARADDGIVEAIERPDRDFVLAIQWHPESRIDVNLDDHRLFAAFASAVLRGPTGGEVGQNS